MSRDGRIQESRTSIVIVPTTTSYELEPSQEERAHRKRKRCAASSVVPHCQTSGRDAGCLRTLVRVLSKTNTLLTAGGGKSSSVIAPQDQTYCPKNYLMSGGHRAAAKDREDQLLQLNRAAIKVDIPACQRQYAKYIPLTHFVCVQDLRNANSALANELSRTRLACQEVRMLSMAFAARCNCLCSVTLYVTNRPRT